MRYSLLASLTIAALGWTAAAPADEAGSTTTATLAPATDSAATDSADAGWTSLFDGTSLDAWKGYKRDELPAGWAIDDGMLTCTHTGGKGRGDDLVTREQFNAFEFQLQWKMSEGGNSGVMYLVSEDKAKPYHTGPEYQLLDNLNHKDGGAKLLSAGSLYALYPATVDPKPLGEWNTTRIRYQDSVVTHWLNGAKVCQVEIGGDDWNQKVADSKFAKWKQFGKNTGGHLVLQDHGFPVWFRDIKVRRLD